MSLKTRLTLRYAGALSLVALVLTGAWFILQDQLGRNAQDAWLINTAGQQRMLSQRIALLSDELTATGDANARDGLAAALRDAIGTMRRNHADLTGARGAYARSPEVQARYDGPGGLDARVSAYLAVADAFLATLPAAQAGHTHPDRLVELAAHQLLDPLDAVVGIYQRDSERKLARFRLLETVMVVIGLAVLALEAALIFRPMVRHIDSTVRSLETVNGELREFSFRVSHDLRAPVASAAGMVAVARGALDDEDPTAAQYALSRVHNAVHGLDQLITDIIAVARREEASDPEPVHLAELIDDIVSRLATMPRADHVNVACDIATDDPVVTSRRELQQIVENLVSNAIKYTDAAVPEVHIAAGASGGHLVVRVRDNGSGIAPEYRSELFGMFKRFHKEHTPGSGLGLYLSRRLARTLGGDLIYSALAPGSEFSLTLPAAGGVR